MYCNSLDCPHCGKRFTRWRKIGPIINRSDGRTFHLNLFLDLEPRPKASGGFYEAQALCYFTYTHAASGPKTFGVAVVIVELAEDLEQWLQQLEDIADQLAAVLEWGRRLAAVYTLENSQLTPGFPVQSYVALHPNF